MDMLYGEQIEKCDGANMIIRGRLPISVEESY